MAVLALADMLPDFGAPRALPGSHPSNIAEGSKEQSAETLEKRLAREIAAAEAALTERLLQEHEEKLAMERARHAEEMAEAIDRMGKETAAAIAARFAEMEQQVVATTSTVAARILGLVLTGELQKRAVEEFGRLLTEALKDRDTLRIRVQGPAFLFETLREHMGERAGQLKFIEAPGIDLTAEIDQSLIETRLAEWSQMLAEALS